MKKRMARPMARAATPPTTPPTIGATFVLDFSSESFGFDPEDEVGDDVEPEVAVTVLISTELELLEGSDVTRDELAL